MTACGTSTSRHSLRAGPSGDNGQCVHLRLPEHDHLFVGNPVGYGMGRVLRERHPRVLGLGAVDHASHQFDTSPMITHRFGLDEFETAYDVFGNAAETGALKVLLTAAR